MSQLEDTGGQHGLVWTQRTLITVYASVMAVMVAAGCSRSRAKWRQSREETIVRTLLRCPLQRRNLWLSQHYNTNMLLMLLSEAGNAAAGINPNDFWSNKIGQVNAFLEKTGRWRRWRRWKLALVLTLNIVNSPRANLKASSICWMVKCIVDIDENWISKNQ